MRIESQAGSKKTRLILAIFIFGVMSVTGWILNPAKPATLPEAPPLAVVTLPSGHVLEVLRAEDAPSMRLGRLTVPPRKIMGTGKSSSGNHGTRMEIERTTAYGATTVESATLIRDYPGLILAARLRDPRGDAYAPNEVTFHGQGKTYPINWTMDGFYQQLTSPGSTPAAVTVEVEDGAGGWFPLNGPWSFHQADKRVFFWTQVFPRHNPRLRMRFSAPGDSPVEFDIANPGCLAPPKPAWAADALPARLISGSTAIEVTRLLRKNSGGKTYRYPFADTEVIPVPGQPPDFLNVYNTWIEDESGNRGEPADFRILPGAKLVRFHLEAHRSHTYQWADHEATFLAEGVWTGTSGTESLTLLPAAAAYGAKYLFLEADPQGTMVELGGHALPTVFPDYVHLICFIDGATTSNFGGIAGISKIALRRTVTTPLDYRYRTMAWTKLKPGQRVRVGLMPNVPPVPFEITLPVP